MAMERIISSLPLQKCFLCTVSFPTHLVAHDREVVPVGTVPSSPVQIPVILLDIVSWIKSALLVSVVARLPRARQISVVEATAFIVWQPRDSLLNMPKAERTFVCPQVIFHREICSCVRLKAFTQPIHVF